VIALKKDWPIYLFSANRLLIIDNRFTMGKQGGAIMLSNIKSNPENYMKVSIENNEILYDGQQLKKYNFLGNEGNFNMYTQPKRVKIKENKVKLKDNSNVKLDNSSNQ